MKKSIFLILVCLSIALVLSACGSNSPASNGGGTSPKITTTANTPTSLIMTVDFPSRSVTGTPTSPTALLSASTNQITLSITDCQTNLVIGSASLVAPAGGGIASTAIVLSGSIVTQSYVGPVNVDVISTAANGQWLGNAKLTWRYITAGATNIIPPITMLEINQGIVIPAASRPIFLSPDGSQYTINKILIGTPVPLTIGAIPPIGYNVGIEANVVPANASMMPYMAVIYSTAYGGGSWPYVMDDNFNGASVALPNPQVTINPPLLNQCGINFAFNPYKPNIPNITMTGVTGVNAMGQQVVTTVNLTGIPLTNGVVGGQGATGAVVVVQ